MPAWSGLWNREFGQNFSQLNNTKEFNNTEIATLRRAFRGRGNRVIGAVLRALTGSAVGATASQTYSRVQADVHLGKVLAGGGKRTVETVTDINRVTTAADEALVDALTNAGTAPSPYPRDKSGIGAGNGSKLGGF